MKVSIITVTLNSAKTIEDTLLSVQNQSFTNIEHIIIDGNSEDETAEIVKKFHYPIKFISEPDNGIYDAMNKGISLATGDIIAILNSDDFYTTPFVLQKVIKAFEENDIECLYGNLDYVERFNTSNIVRRWKSGKMSNRKFTLGWMPPHPTFFVKKEAYIKYGVFNTTLKYAADYELMLRFLYKHQSISYYLPEVLVKMRTGGVTNSNKQLILQSLSEIKKAWLINDLHFFFLTPFLKPIRKIFQLF